MSTYYTERVAEVLAAHRLYRQFVYDGTPPLVCSCGETFHDEHLHDQHVAERINYG